MSKRKIRSSKKVLIGFLLIIGIGWIVPQKFSMPVEGATSSSYNAKSFWYYPWGKSGTHKGVDIFAKEGTNLVSATSGLVIYKGQLARGGNVVLILGPKWRVHYYAHLKDFNSAFMDWKSRGEYIGTVGTTGNAKGKPAHLHYSIISIFPHFWRWDTSIQGWKKMFYLNPIIYLK